MNKTVKKLVLLTTLTCLVSSAMLSNSTLLNIDVQRVLARQQYYNLFVERAKRFRKLVYTAGGVTAAGLVSYISYRMLRDTGEQDSSSAVSRVGVKSGAGLWIGALSARKLTRIKHALMQDVDLSQRCQIGFWDGVSDGFYYGAIGVVASIFLAAQTKGLDSISDAFLKRWKLKDENLFWGARKSLEVGLRQVRSFFVDGYHVYDKEEFIENYKVFIYALENFMGLILAHTAQSFTSDQSEPQTIANLQELLCKKVLSFSEQLQVELNKSSGDNFENGISLATFNMFKQLNNQVIRFVNHCQNTIYETESSS